MRESKSAVNDTKLDLNGRVYIPSSVRRLFDLKKDHSRIEIRVDGDCIVLLPRNEK